MFTRPFLKKLQLFVRLMVHQGEYNTQIFRGLLGTEYELVIMPGSPQAVVGRSWEVNALDSHPLEGQGVVYMILQGFPALLRAPFPTAVAGLNCAPLFCFPSFPASLFLLAALAF